MPFIYGPPPILSCPGRSPKEYRYREGALCIAGSTQKSGPANRQGPLSPVTALVFMTRYDSASPNTRTSCSW